MSGIPRHHEGPPLRSPREHHVQISRSSHRAGRRMKHRRVMHGVLHRHPQSRRTRKPHAARSEGDSGVSVLGCQAEAHEPAAAPRQVAHGQGHGHGRGAATLHRLSPQAQSHPHRGGFERLISCDRQMSALKGQGELTSGLGQEHRMMADSDHAFVQWVEPRPLTGGLEVAGSRSVQGQDKHRRHRFQTQLPPVGRYARGRCPRGCRGKGSLARTTSGHTRQVVRGHTVHKRLRRKGGAGGNVNGGSPPAIALDAGGSAQKGSNPRDAPGAPGRQLLPYVHPAAPAAAKKREER